MRTVPAALQAHLDSGVTTTCRLLCITLTSGQQFGMTTLDQDVVYQGVTYSAVNGMDTSVIATDSGLSVDNGEGYALLSADVPGITVSMALTGQFDDAQWELLLINYRDHSMGHIVLDAGDVGEVRVANDAVFMPELLSYVMRLRQAIGTVWSIRCRGIFGTPRNSPTGCGVNAELLWMSGTVTAMSDEPRRVFASSDMTGIDPAPVPGRVRWTSGPNASERLYQVEAYGPGTGTIALLEPVPFDIEVGHTFDLRPDCAKNPTACAAYGNYVNYNGEPLIPVGDGAEVLTPGSQTPGGFVGSEVVEP